MTLVSTRALFPMTRNLWSRGQQLTSFQWFHLPKSDSNRWLCWMTTSPHQRHAIESKATNTLWRVFEDCVVFRKNTKKGTKSWVVDQESDCQQSSRFSRNSLRRKPSMLCENSSVHSSFRILISFRQPAKSKQGDRMSCGQRVWFRSRPHVYGYFWIRNFFFPDTAIVHTHTANSQANPEIF